MSDRRHHSSNRHHSGGGPSRSTPRTSIDQQYTLPTTTYRRPSHDQQYTLPDTTYAGSGGGHNSGGSYPEPSSEPSLRGIYSQYGRPGGTTNTPPRRDSQRSSQRSQEVLLMYRGTGGTGNSNSMSVPLVYQGSDPSRSHEGSLNSGSHASSERRRAAGARVAVGNTAAFAVQMEFGDAPQDTKVFDENSKSAEALARRRRLEQGRLAAGNNPFKKLIQKSREEIERLRRRKK